MKVVLRSSNSRHRSTGISFRSLFMYILGTRGFGGLHHAVIDNTVQTGHVYI